MDYQFAKLRRDRTVDTVQTNGFFSDNDAFAHARAFGDGYDVEVWSLSKHIATVTKAFIVLKLDVLLLPSATVDTDRAALI